MGWIGDEDQRFDFVGDVFYVDAEVPAHEVECFVGGLPFAGFDPLQVRRGNAGFDGECVLGYSFGFPDCFDRSSECFSFAHRKKVAGMRRVAQVGARRNLQECASYENPRQCWEARVNYNERVPGNCACAGRKDFFACAILRVAVSTREQQPEAR